MNIKSLYTKISLAVAVVFAASCEVTEMEPTNSPNALGPDQYNLDSYVTSIQVGLASYFEEGTDFGMQVTRQLALTGGSLYSNAFEPADFDDMWRFAYSDVLSDTKSLIAEADEKQATVHAAYGRIIQAYVLMTLVDYFGDIPFSEALQGSGNLAPKLDQSAGVYNAAFELLNEAIENLNTESVLDPPAVDLFYGGDTDQWMRLANSLKLRYYLQSRGVTANADDSIQFIIENKDLMETGDDFQFSWSTNLSNPDSRHPEFATNYDNGAEDYMANYFMNLLRTDYGVVDPRTRYYFYRQTTTTSTNTNELPCIVFTKPSHYSTSDPYCALTSGYWGRDHGDDDGIPPDGLLRTIWGAYPIGGQYDRSEGDAGSQDAGAAGKGISPIFMASFVKFMRAEAALVANTGEDAAALLEEAVTESVGKVKGFPAEIGYTISAAPTELATETYVAAVMAAFNGAGSQDEQLEIISREYLKATFGNGFESFNMYRRTGHPTNLQPMLLPEAGPAIRSFIYPSDLVSLNTNAKQKADMQVRVFWDDGSITLD